MYIFIETTFDIQTVVAANNQFLYTDAIEFDSGSNLQKVELVTLVKDAVFIYPNRDSEGVIETLTFDVDGDGNDDETSIQGRFLTDSELTFTNERPYVIYGYAAVDEGKTLNIDAGARVHFHANSGLLITNNASLKVNGQLSTDQDILENEVVFEGDRLEPLFEDIPGQWGTIWLRAGSKENEINHTHELSRQDIAELVGLNSNQVTKILADLKEDNILETDNKKIKIINLKKLKEIVNI